MIFTPSDADALLADKTVPATKERVIDAMDAILRDWASRGMSPPYIVERDRLSMDIQCRMRAEPGNEDKTGFHPTFKDSEVDAVVRSAYGDSWKVVIAGDEFVFEVPTA